MSIQLPEEQGAPPPTDPLAGLFNAMLRNGLRSTLVEVQQAVALLTEEARQRAWHLLSYALRSGEAWPETRDLLLLLAPKMEQAGFREEWIAYLTSGVAVGTQHNDRAATAEFALQIAILWRMLSEYDRAVQWLASSLAGFRQEQDRRGEARALNERAWIEQLRRRYDEASQHVEQALALLGENDPERGMCYRTQGMIAIYRGEWEKAEKYHRKSLEVFEQDGSDRKASWASQNLAVALRGQNKYQSSIEYFLKATTIMLRLGDMHHWSIAQTGLGLAYYHTGEIDNAVQCYLEAEAIATQRHDQLQLARIHNNLGLAYLAKNMNIQAVHSFQQAIQLFESLDDQGMVVNCMDGLAVSFIAQHNFEDAIHTLNQAILLLPKIVNVPNFSYFQESLYKHLKEATSQQATLFASPVNITL